MPTSRVLKNIARFGFVVIVLLVAVATISVVHRSIDSTRVLVGSEEAGTHPFESRYRARPILTLIHVVSGLVFVVTGPFQFAESFRRRNMKLHRFMGRLFIVSGVIAAVTSLIYVAVLPVFGSFSSSVAVTLGAILFLVSIGRAFWCVRRRQIKLHREWMIRSFALGLGIATFRVLLPILMAPPFRATFVEAWDTVTWLGFTVNLMVAEAWINLTRAPSPAFVAREGREQPNSSSRQSAV